MLDATFYIAIVSVLFYAFWSGFSDGPGIMAAALSSRMLDPKVVLFLVMIGEVAGSLMGTAVAGFISSKMINSKGLPIWSFALTMCITIAWSYFCYTKGIPISETHSLIGSLIGVTLAIGGFQRVQMNNVLMLMAFTVIGPLIAFIFARITSKIIGFVASIISKQLGKITFDIANVASILSMSFAHGNNDAQKPIGMIFLLLSIVGASVNTGENQNLARYACIALALIGVAIGGKKILHTLTERIGKVNVYQAVNSQITSTAILEFFTKLAVPVSTTQIMTAGMVGSVGSNKKVHVRSEIVKEIMTSWVVTIPVTVLVGFVLASIGNMIK
ncbi:MAG: inorganic phosphate transporter [Patescibacteria group bacterium]